MTQEEMVDLKVGDLVCDCRYQHHRVVRVEEERFPHRSLDLVYSLLHLMRLDLFSFYNPLMDCLERVWPQTRLVDKQLTLEDGCMCSAIHCCHLAPHPGWEHPKGY